ncbi:MAG: rhomboid family intramembrane serine protease [Candidatus Pacearchaeota archaeon]|nr:rhomboid family intramembrane serine protease [Candidatus Pacearchaeota archaeon]
MVRVHKISNKNNFLDNMTFNTKIILINIALFVFFNILILTNIKYLDYIAIKPANIFAGKYLWTFLTSIFMHGGLFHLFANMFSLMFIGSLVEKIVGKTRYIYFYLTAGILSGAFFVLSSLILQSDFNVYAVGASGALFGLVGFLMIITPELPVYVMFIPIPIKMKYAAPGILIVLWLISAAGSIPIGNTAHLGGLIVGLTYGLHLKKKYRNKTNFIKRHFS